jgi:mono/diheme cytochrome c family protein
MQSRGDGFAVRLDGFVNVPRDGEYQFHLTSDDGSRMWIDGKLVVDNDGIHSPLHRQGRVRLTAGLHPIRVGFIQGNGGAELLAEIEGPGLPRQQIPAAMLTSTDKPPANRRAFVVDAALAAQGKQLFTTVGCASCHPLGPGYESVAQGPLAKPLSQLVGSQGCMSSAASNGRPQYHLSQQQTSALAAALSAIKTAKLPGLTAPERIAHTMTVLNCYACHERDGRGGVPASRFDRFSSDDKDLGDEGRIPPRLTGVGDKLTDKWLAEVMVASGVARPYMHARMPQFGAANVVHLAKDFAAVDRQPERFAKELVPRDAARKAGRDLVGKNALTCISCHMFNRQRSTGIQAMDLVAMPQRLRRDWFFRYMLDPQSFRPGTRMPSSFPGGKSTVPRILLGDAPQQIDAMWTYLSDGRRAKFPDGVVRQTMEIVVGGEAVIYRNFIEGAGPRAIAVGYPEEVNIAFDANALRLALIWQGKFIDASKHWGDRGAGFQSPLGDDVVRLVDGAPFAMLGPSPDKTPWPKASGKQAGYQFRGYQLDHVRRPTFCYTLGNLEIEDFPAGADLSGAAAGGAAGNATDASNQRAIVRTFTLTSPGPVAGVWYRAAAASKIEAATDGSFRIGESLTMRFQLPGGAKPVLRHVGGPELIVPVTFTDGKARFVQEYRW